MKKSWFILSGIVLAVILVGAGGCAYGEGARVSPPSIAGYVGAPTITSSQQQVGLWVNGEGKSKAAPDVVLLSLGIEAESKTVARAQQDAAVAMDAVIKALKSNGVADKDIQTQRFSISPVTQWIEDQQRQIITGYRVTNVVIAKIRQVDKAGPVIDAVADAGGNLTR
ncbi:MAG: SIMPL domain-containing protein, partial [Dehalococcoidia bacterium]|nr:SIMPL domain-containing protein [Dehalococcoidia bacterium]